jgi:REP element-mobilizing transposase RayT
MKIEYNNLYTHFVFTTLHREPIILEKNRERIEKFITGIVKNYHCKLYSIYANPDHVHFLISRSPSISEEYLATQIAESSAKFINENNLAKGDFCWQDTASAFSVSKRDIDKICKYILNQKEHHRKVTFIEEYEKFIKFYEKSINSNKG